MDRFLHAYVALTSLFTARRDDEEGATAVEYGIMVGLIAVAIIVTVGLIGTELNRLFNTVLTELQGAN